MTIVKKTNRAKYNVSEVGDIISVGERLIYAGGKEHDRQLIKRGVELLISVGYPIRFVDVITRHLIQEAKKS